jgi:hypothetical protein
MRAAENLPYQRRKRSRNISYYFILVVYDCSRHRFLGIRYRGAVYATARNVAFYLRPGSKIVFQEVKSLDVQAGIEVMGEGSKPRRSLSLDKNTV